MVVACFGAYGGGNGANIAPSFYFTIMPRPSRAPEHLNRAFNYAAAGLVVGTAAYNAVWNEETRDRNPFLTTLLQGAALAAIAGAMKKALSFKRCAYTFI